MPSHDVPPMSPEVIWLSGLAVGLTIGVVVGFVVALVVPFLVDILVTVARRDRRA